MQFKEFLTESESTLERLIESIQKQYPQVINLWASENSYKIHLSEIRVGEKYRGQGIGTKVIRMLQEYAKLVEKPITLSPTPDLGKKAKLLNFYKYLGFYLLRGRKMDYRLSNPFGPTWVWRPS